MNSKSTTSDNAIAAYSVKAAMPLPVRAFNAIGKGLGTLGIGSAPMNMDDLMESASRAVKLHDFGDGRFKEGLRLYLESLDGEASLTALGRLTARMEVVQKLKSRLQMTDHIKKNPEIRKSRVDRPLFIVGLARTGTTILHYLLDCDPAFRSPLSWECLSPYPPPEPSTYQDDPRIARVQKQFDRLYQLIPGFEAVHPMSAMLPQECVNIWTYEFKSQQFFVQYNVPSYQKWVDGQSMTDVYAAERLFLQFLQSGGVKYDRWLLKSPGHLNYLEDLLDEFPDAAIIHTHRDPVTVVASVTSLMSMLRSISSDAVDPHLIGRQMIDWLAFVLEESVAQRKRLKARENQFYDIHLSDIVADPLKCVKGAYDHFGFTLTPEVRSSMERFMRNNARDKHGIHRYAPEDFGIDIARDRARFEPYLDYYNDIFRGARI